LGEGGKKFIILATADTLACRELYVQIISCRLLKVRILIDCDGWIIINHSWLIRLSLQGVIIEAPDVLDFTPTEGVQILFPWYLLLNILLFVIISRLRDLITKELGLV